MPPEQGLMSVDLCVVWSAEKPRRENPRRESRVFTLRGRECKVSLMLYPCGYGLYLLGRHRERITFRPFVTTVCIARGSAEYLRQRTVAWDNKPPIWSGSFPALREHVPGFDEARFLLFRMIFSSESSPDFTDSFTRPETAQKSIQTPIYLETDPCLQSLSLDFGRLLDGQTDPRPDVKFKCVDNVTIRAHASVLGARSEVFSRLLHTDMVEGRTGQVKIEDMDSGYFAEFLRYVYTGILPELTAGLAKALYEAGDKYAVGSLTRRCADFMSENMTQENALEYLALADAHNDRDFKEKAWAYIIDKDIPLQENHWLPFSNEHPKIAAEVFQRGFKLFRPQ